MRTLVRVVGIVLAVLLLLILGLMAVLQTEWFKHEAARQLSDQLGREVAFQGSHHIDWSMRPLIRVDDVRLANAPWAEPPNMARAESVAVRIDLWSLAQGQLHFRRIELESPQVHLARAEDGRTNWAFLTEGEPTEETEGTQVPEVDHFIVEDGIITYDDAEHRNSLEFATAARKDTETVQAEVRGTGHVAEIPVGLELSASAPDLTGPMTVEGMLESGEHQADLSGEIATPMELEGLDLALAMTGPDPRPLLEGQSDQALPEIGAYRLSMRLLHENAAWSLRDLNGHIGESQLEGEAEFDPANQDRPFVEVDLAVDELNLDARGVFPDDEGEDEISEIPSAQELRTNLEPLRQFDGDVRLRIGQLQAFEVTSQNLEVNASLRQGVLQVAPLSASLAGGEVTVSSELEVGEESVRGALTAEASPLQLDALVPQSEMLNGVLYGQLRLRLIPEYLLADTTELHFRDDARELAFRYEAGTRQNEQEGLRTQMRVVGVRHGQDFVGDLVIGPLLQLGSDTAVDMSSLYARLHAGEGVIVLRGDLQPLLAQPAFDLAFSVQGSDIEGFGALLGVEVPTIPSYEIHGRMSGEPSNLQVRVLDAQVGESDLVGEIDLRLEEEQPLYARAEFRSDYLNMDDFIQEDAPEGPEPDVRGLLEAVNGEVHFRGRRVDILGIPLEAVLLQTKVDGIRMELQPLELQLGGGDLQFSGYLDGEQPPMRGHLEGEAQQVDLAEILSTIGTQDASGGYLSGALEVDTTGSAPDDWISSAVGELRMLMTGGQVDRLLAELAGEDMAEEIMEFLMPPEAAVLDLDCAHLAVDADAGELIVRNFFVTTPTINVIGDGVIDLQRQTLDLTIGSEAEDPDLLDLLTPVEVTGPWEDPEISVLTAELLARALAALTLGVVLAPGAAAAPAALAPLLAGLGEEATPCHEVVEQATEEMEAVEEE